MLHFIASLGCIEVTSTARTFGRIISTQWATNKVPRMTFPVSEDSFSMFLSCIHARHGSYVLDGSNERRASCMPLDSWLDLLPSRRVSRIVGISDSQRNKTHVIRNCTIGLKMRQEYHAGKGKVMQHPLLYRWSSMCMVTTLNPLFERNSTWRCLVEIVRISSFHVPFSIHSGGSTRTSENIVDFFPFSQDCFFNICLYF